MIKWSYRRNIIYLIFLFVYYYLRKITSIIMNQVFKFNNSLLFTFLMVLGEIFGGLSLYIYQEKFISKNNTKFQHFKFSLITNEFKMKPIDGKVKIYILIFFASFFDFIEYVISDFFVPRLGIISPTSDQRLCCICTISSSLICTYALKMKIGRHHICTLIGMGLCSLLIIILDFYYGLKGIDDKIFSNFIWSYLLIIGHFVFLTFTDVIEKYIIENNYLNPFRILALEGFFSFIMCSIYSIGNNPFKEIGNLEISAGYWVLLIFLLFLYFVFSAGVNVYKILCNVLYSPMGKSLPAFSFNPVFIIYYFFYENDFLSENKPNYYYFIANFILSIFIDFLAFVYNEFLILFCCGLEHGTHYGITNRSKIDSMKELDDFKKIYDYDKHQDDLEDSFSNPEL